MVTGEEVAMAGGSTGWFVADEFLPWRGSLDACGLEVMESLIAGREPTNPDQIKFLEICHVFRKVMEMGGSGTGVSKKRSEIMRKTISLCKRSSVYGLMRMLIPDVRNSFALLLMLAQISCCR